MPHDGTKIVPLRIENQEQCQKLLATQLTAATVQYSCCHKTSKLLYGVVLVQRTLLARQHLASRTWKSTL